MAALAIVNPKKRRKAKKGGAVKARRSNPVKKIKTRRRRNPVAAKSVRRTRRSARRRNPISGSALTKHLMPALTGAAGAAVVDKAIDMFGGYLPAQLRTGWGRYLALAGIAWGIGFGLEKAKLLSPATRNSLVGGALTVTAYKAISTELMPMVNNITTLPAPAAAAGTRPAPAAAAGTKGFQDASLMGFQPAMTLGEMVNNAPVSGDFMVAGSGYST